MARNSMMSEIDGLVTNLHTDINKMMESSKRIKDQQAQMSQTQKKSSSGAEDLKASADLKENYLRQSEITLMTSMMNDTALRESAVDETVLQKRPSNPKQQQRFS